jgi:putative isomerase
MRVAAAVLALVAVGSACGAQTAGKAEANADPAWAAGLRAEVKTLGKPAWRPMLNYDVTLHIADTHPAEPPFPYPWEDTGRGYGYGPGFGHWDLVHAMIDELPVAKQHVREQLLDDIGLQLPSGFLPGLYWMRKPAAGAKADPGIYDDANAKYSPTQGNPPLWVVAADDYLRDAGGDRALEAKFLAAARLQLGWFERERRAKPDGFLYLDIVNHKWESGVDEGIRFDDSGLAASHPNSTACVDATSHVYQEYVYAAKWARELGEDAAPLEQRAADLRRFIQTKLWDPKDGFFYDSWIVDGTVKQRTESFEGMWPVVVGAATPEQGRRVVDEWLMNPKRFFTPHPIATVAVSDPKFELRMWRGPVWNSMTYWAARGMLRYDRAEDARRMLAAALDDTAAQYDRTGKLWEFYSPFDGKPEDLKRKPETKRNEPFPDYMGHNPMLAMARLWARIPAPGTIPATSPQR